MKARIIKNDTRGTGIKPRSIGQLCRVDNRPVSYRRITELYKDLPSEKHDRIFYVCGRVRALKALVASI